MCYYTDKESYGLFPLSLKEGEIPRIRSIFKALPFIYEEKQNFLFRKGVVRKCLNL